MPFRADLPLYLAPHVHVSLKELNVLPARIFTTLLLPPGVIGSAADAVEFLELSGQHGLARLDADKARITESLWRAPRIDRESANAALCDATGTSAFYYAGALTDWLTVIAGQSAGGTVVLSGGDHADYFAAVPYWLAQRGHSSAIVQITGAGAATAVVGVVRKNGWIYDRVDGANLPKEVAVGTDLTAFGAIGLEWLADFPRAKIPPLEAHRAPIVRTIAIVSRTAPLGFARAGLFSSADFAAKREQALQEGWPMDRELWERLMAFADRSLIASSERSRLGAGYAKDGVVE